MLWTLIKILIAVAVVGGIVYGIEWIIADGEGILIAFAGYEVVLGPLQTVIAAILLVVAIWLFTKVLGFVWAVLRFVTGDETALTRFFYRRREARGHALVTEGLMALAEGDAQLALRKSQKAEAKLDNDAAPYLLAAQAAEQLGDGQIVTDSYRKMLEDEKTRFVAIKGLMKHKQAAGDEDTARELAKKALELKPSNTETADQLFLMQTHDSDWSGARSTLGLKRRHKSAPKDMAKRRDGLLALCQARDLRAEGKIEDARRAAMDAAKELPGFAPAVVEAARAYLEVNNKNKAASLIKTAWAAEPHPSLAAVFAEIMPEETPAARIKRFGELVKKDPNHAEARMLMAELNIAAEQFPEARRALGDLVETDVTMRVMTIMAAVERGEGADDTTIKAWLAKAVTAPRGPAWVCDKEGAVYAEWQPVCDVCGGFDTLTWKAAPAAEVMSADSVAGMLPLIIGALEDKSADTVEEAEEAETAESTPDEKSADAA